MLSSGLHFGIFGCVMTNNRCGAQAGVANTTHFNVLLKETLAEAASALEAEEVAAAVLAQMDTVSRIIVTTSRRFFWP